MNTIYRSLNSKKEPTRFYIIILERRNHKNPAGSTRPRRTQQVLPGLAEPSRFYKDPQNPNVPQKLMRNVQNKSKTFPETKVQFLTFHRFLKDQKVAPKTGPEPSHNLDMRTRTRTR